MEHAYLNSPSVETPWRTAAIVAAAVAALELFILVLVGVVVAAKLTGDHAEKVVNTVMGKTAATAAPAKTASASTEAPAKAAAPNILPRRRTSVIVLNGNGLPGAAAVTADRARGFHYIIAATGNASRTDFQRSVVMYRPGRKAEGIRLAHDLHVRRAVPLDGMTRSDLQGAHLAIIIGG